MKRYSLSLLVVFQLFLFSSAYSQDADTTSYGWFSAHAYVDDLKVDSLWVVLNQDFENPIFYLRDDSIRVESGRYSITLIHPDYRDIRAYVNVNPDQHTKLITSFIKEKRFDSSLSSYKRITEGLVYNISISTDESSFVVINDSTYGKGSVITDIGPYLHNIRIEHPTARNRSQSVYINPSGQVDLSIFALPRRSTAMMFTLLPGASQIYKNQQVKGYSLAIATPVTLILAGFKQFSFNQLNNEYESMLIRYSSMTDERKVLEFGNLVDDKYNSVKQAAMIRDYALVTAAGLYLYNLLDAIFVTPKSGYRVKVEPADFNTHNRYSAGLKMSVDF